MSGISHNRNFIRNLYWPKFSYHCIPCLNDSCIYVFFCTQGQSSVYFSLGSHGLQGGTRPHREVGYDYNSVSLILEGYPTVDLTPNIFILMFVCRLTRDTPSFKDELDIMKFICKDFWTKVFRRQVDNLRTNHQVTF